MAMEDIDLGRDRSHLIDLIYGKKDAAESVTPSVDSSAPLTVKVKKEKQPPKKRRISCPVAVCIILFLLAVLSMLFAAYAAHRVTRQQFEREIAELQMHPHAQASRNISSKAHTMHHNFAEEHEGDAPKMPTAEELALPKTLTPTWYKVSLDVANLRNNTANGVLLLKVKVNEDTDKIVLNAKDIKLPENVEKVQILQESKKAKRQSKTEQEREMEQMRADDVDVDVASLKDSGIHATGVVVDGDLEMVTIQLDGKLAKDREFVLKPTTSWTLMHSSDATVVTNVDVDATSEDGDRNSSAKTSTSSKGDGRLAPDFVVGELVSVSGKAEGGVSVNVWSREEISGETKFAADFAAQAIDALEHLLQSRMSTEKIEIVGVPGLDTGSRVSNGLILLPESDVAFDEQRDDLLTKVRVGRAIANRIAAQWFGGAMSPAEYGTFWLNDALPKFLELDVVGKLLDIDADEIWRWEMEAVLRKDARANSQPLRNPHVHSSTQIANVDHRLAADKGAAILRMLNEVVGEETFNKAIRSFVNSHRAGEPLDNGLWASFQKALPKNVKGWDGKQLDVAKFVDTWINQMGFPVVSVRRLDEENVEFTQERFKTDNLTPEQWKFRNAMYWFNWEVPLVVEVNGARQPLQWLHEAYRLPLNTSDVLVVNPDGRGMYRVDYEPRMWRTLVDKLRQEPQKMKATTKARLLSDAFALAFAGRLPYEVALNVSSCLSAVKEALPWAVGVNELGRVASNLRDQPQTDKFNKFVTDKTRPKFDEINFDASDDSSFIKKILEKELIDVECDVDPEACGRKFRSVFTEKFAQACKDGEMSSTCSMVPSSLRDVAYCNGVAYGDEETFNRIQNASITETSPEEQTRLRRSLACSRDPRMVRMILRKALNGSDNGDATTMLSQLNRQPVGREIATNFVVDNWKSLHARFGDDVEALNKVVDAAVAIDNDRERHTVEAFMERHRKSTSGVDAFAQKLEKSLTTVRWRRLFADDVAAFLNGKMRPHNDDADADQDE